MITLTETITSPKPRAEVFTYVADFSTVAEWDPGIQSSTRTSGDGGVGTVYAVEATFAGRVVPMTYEVTGFEPGHRIVLRGIGDAVEAIDTITFADHGEATRVVYSAEFTLKGFMRFLELPMRPLFTRLGKKAIGGLREALGG